MFRNIVEVQLILNQAIHQHRYSIQFQDYSCIHKNYLSKSIKTLISILSTLIYSLLMKEFLYIKIKMSILSLNHEED